MKRFIVLLALILISIAIKALPAKEDVCYVKTADKIYFGQDLKIGIVYTKVIANDGSISKIRNRDIKAYSQDGKLYEMLPLVCEKNDTVCYKLLEYVTSRNGLKLYRYNCNHAQRDETCGYWVFKDNKLFLRVTENNAYNVLPFFGIKKVI